MPILAPNDGEVALLTELLASGENWTLKLYSSNTTPAETDVAATHTVANFTGYVDKTLTRTVGASTWNTPAQTGTTLETSNAKSTYGAAAQSWSATSAQTIYGYILIGATSTKLLFAERFATSVALVNPSTLSFSPVMELG